MMIRTGLIGPRPTGTKALISAMTVEATAVITLVQNQKGMSILLQEKFKSTLDDAQGNFLADNPLDPRKRPEKKVNNTPESRAMNLMTNDSGC